MTDETKQKIKTALLCTGFATLGFVLAWGINGTVSGGIGGLIFGFLGLANRRGIQRTTDIADDIGDNLDRAGNQASDIDSGIDRAADGVDRAETVVDGAARDNLDARESIGRAKEILDRARSRAKPGTDR